jgi:hypothetical protein
MGLNSTPFLSYHKIQVDDIDIYEDAWGFNSEFADVINLLNLVKPVPEKRLTKRLIERVRQQR